MKSLTEYIYESLNSSKQLEIVSDYISKTLKQEDYVTIKCFDGTLESVTLYKKNLKIDITDDAVYYDGEIGYQYNDKAGNNVKGKLVRNQSRVTLNIKDNKVRFINGGADFGYIDMQYIK